MAQHGSGQFNTVQHSLDQLNSKIFLSSILRLGDVLKVPETNCDHELFNRVVSMATLKTYFYTALSSDEHYGWQYIFLVCIITSNTTLGLRLLNAKKQIFIYFSCFLGKNRILISCINCHWTRIKSQFKWHRFTSSNIMLLKWNQANVKFWDPPILCLSRKLKEVIINQNKLPRFNLWVLY